MRLLIVSKFSGIKDDVLKINALGNLLNDKQMGYRMCAGIVLLSYLIIYLIYLILTNFLPYGFDNNETFSSLVHAKNLYNFGFRNSFGLTEEAYGLLKSAHPYVYTHQGNFPRFYTYFLYCLGFRTAEWQIFITTFTIGLVGIAFCYHFFAKYVSCFFATIFCLLLMTDYVMFMQWQVNTWRVWHLFFFFSSFLCCHGLNGKHRKFFVAISILNFACLFYTELSFATFVLISVCVYLFLQSISMRTKLTNCLIWGAGALLGICILVGQDIAFLGWNVFLKDLTYTFTARNQVSLSTSKTMPHVLEFYAKNKIVFWANFNGIENIRSFKNIIQSFYRLCILPYYPLITLSSSIMLLGTWLSYLCRRIPKKGPTLFNTAWASKQMLPITTAVTTAFFLLSFIALSLTSYSTLLGNKTVFIKLMECCLILSACIVIFCNWLSYCIKIQKNDPTIYNTLWIAKHALTLVTTAFFLLSLLALSFISYPATLGKRTFLIEMTSACPLSCILLLGVVFFVTYARSLYNKSEAQHNIISIHNVAPLLFFLLTIGLCVVLFRLNQYSGPIVPILQTYSLKAIGGASWLPLIIGMVLLISIPHPDFSPKFICLDALHSFKKLAPFWIATCIGFICSYLIFPGYIRSGYLVRYCCFTVFAHMTLYAWLFYGLSSQIMNLFCLEKSKGDTRYKKYLGIHLPCSSTWLKLGARSFLLLLFTYSWINLQWIYIKEFPPADFRFISLFKTEPFHRKPIISNTYVAPFAYVGKSWGYLDPDFGNSEIINGKHGRYYNYIHDLRYLWFADGFGNPRYKKPKLYVCWLSYYAIEQLGQPKPHCGDIPLIRDIRNQASKEFGLVEVAHDETGRDKWSIVALPETVYLPEKKWRRSRWINYQNSFEWVINTGNASNLCKKQDHQ